MYLKVPVMKSSLLLVPKNTYFICHENLVF